MRFRVPRYCIPVSIVLLNATFAVYAQRPRVEDYSKHLAPRTGSPEHAVDKMLEMASLKPGETLYDLGCGDGRILIAAAQRYRVKAVGIEISNDLARTAAEKVKKAGLENAIKVVHGDFMQTDLSGANVVTLYLATTANDTLRPNLEHYLRPNTRVVSYDYPIPGWKPVETAESQGRHGATHMIYLYEVPDSIKK
ncbi:MAG: class I SAM-dependent methyltransferase [Acidobacteriaceae bacterium]|nr:class I SAM-dependent methyltransferase [Acidobacteriaceae bacterium]MBV9296838.1 class I SAM-dependent methyltransferase [Acidobacteriaceae bacterium]